VQIPSAQERIAFIPVTISRRHLQDSRIKSICRPLDAEIWVNKKTAAWIFLDTFVERQSTFVDFVSE